MKMTSVSLTKQWLLVLCFLFSFSAVYAQEDSLQNAITLSYEHTHFDKQFSHDWRFVSLEYKRQTGIGALIGRVQHANRFAKAGWQFEGEAYPVISKKIYAYTGLSFSNDVPLFAKWRTGASLYYNAARSWELEGGFRYLYFDQPIWMGAAGISRYVGPWLFTARSFFSVHSPADNQSFFLKGQRFLKNEKDFIWVQVGSGVSPDESRSVQLYSAVRLSSKRINAGARLSLNSLLQLTLTAGYARDEYRLKTFGSQYNGSLGLGYRF